MTVAVPAPTSALGNYEPALDGMRGICIVAVVAFHAAAQSGLHGWVRGGFIGVSVFFTLSGFLITSLLLREHATAGRVDFPNFWARRIRRLWPASLVVIGAVVALSAGDRLPAQSSDAIAATLNVTNWHVIAGGQDRLLQTIVGPLGPTWSLAVEEQFYVVLALLLMVATNLSHPRRTLAVAATVGIVLPVALANLATDWQPSLEFNTLLRMPELFAGVLLALWYSNSRRRRQRASLGDAAAAIGLALLTSLFLLVDYSPPWLLRGGYALVAAVTAISLAGLLQHGRVAAALACSPLRWLGLVSYSLYLVHWPVFSLLSQQHTGARGLPLVVVQIVVALVAATALHLVVERPLRRLRAPARTTIAVGLGGAAAMCLLGLVLL